MANRNRVFPEQQSMKYAKFYLPLLFLILAWLSLRPLFVDRSIGSKANPIRIALTPSVDAQKVTANGDRLRKYLEQRTGYSFSIVVPASYIAVVEALGSGAADIAAINTFGYLLANRKYGAEAVLRVVRRDGETTYKGQFIAHVDSGIDSVYQLAGRRFAYTDPSSTSGFILPKAVFKKMNIAPAEEVFAGKHDNVVTMIYQKQVDAGATYYSPPDQKTGEILDARARVVKQFPDVYEKIKIIGFTQSIPNDPIIVRSDFPADMKQRIIDALIAFQSTPEGKKALFEIYSVEGFATAKDSDYDALRAIISEQNVDVENLMKKK